MGPPVEVDSQHRAAQCLEGQRAALDVEVHVSAGRPAPGCLFGDLGDVPGESGHVLLGEDRLQGAPTRQPLLVRHDQQVVTHQPAQLPGNRRHSALGEGVGAAENVAGTLR